MRDGVWVTRFIETLLTWCANAQQVWEAPFSGLGSIRSESEG
jgi:hypothetical protein